MSCFLGNASDFTAAGRGAVVNLSGITYSDSGVGAVMVAQEAQPQVPANKLPPPTMPSSSSIATGGRVPAHPFRDPGSGPLRKLSVDLIKTYKRINEVSALL